MRKRVKPIEETALQTWVIGDLFRAYLDRDPEPEALAFFRAQLASGYSIRDLVEQIRASPEFLARSQQSMPPAAAGARGSTDRARPATVQVVIVTSEGLAKVAAQIRLMRAKMRPGDLITVIDGSIGPAPDPELLERGRVELVRVPGHSVFHLRARLPTVVGDCGWVAVLEDHMIGSQDWLDRVHASIARASQDVAAVAGPFVNLTSTGAWSWANFLITFSQSWHPVPDGSAPSLASNLVFARDLLPNSDFQLCEFEATFVAKTVRGAGFDNAMWADHVQHCGFARATMLQFHNARVAGACMRMAFPNAGVGLKRGLRYLLIDRLRITLEAIRTHPSAKSLPAFTRSRVRWLSLAIAAGYVYGSCFGFGRSPWKLE